MASTTDKGLAYAVVKVPFAAKPPTSWTKLNGVIESIMQAPKESGILADTLTLGKELKLPAGATFVAGHIRAGEVQALSDLGENGPGLVRTIVALEQKGANFIIRASVPAYRNDSAAEVLDAALHILYGARQTPLKEGHIFSVGGIKDLQAIYGGMSGEAEIMGVLHLGRGNQPVCILNGEIVPRSIE